MSDDAGLGEDQTMPRPRRMTHLPPREEWEETFWTLVDQTGDCWLWTGTLQSAGYGMIRLAGESWLSHRIAYWLATGIDPGDKLVCHHCDHPACVRPDHLYLGNKATNMQDAINRGLRVYTTQPRGEKHAAAKLTENQVRQIRARIPGGERYEDIGADFGVSKATVSHIASGRNWGWLR